MKPVKPVKYTMLQTRGSQPGDASPWGDARGLKVVFTWVHLYQWGDAIDVRGDADTKRLGTPAVDCFNQAQGFRDTFLLFQRVLQEIQLTKGFSIQKKAEKLILFKGGTGVRQYNFVSTVGSERILVPLKWFRIQKEVQKETP